MFNDNNFFSGGAAEAGFYDHPIEQSLRFNDDDSAYLSRTPSSSGNLNTWTWSGWVKRGESGNSAYDMLFIAGSYQSAHIVLGFKRDSNDLLQFYQYNSGFNFRLDTSAVYRDYSGWYHIVAVADTTNATAADRVRLYVNGERVTSFSSQTNPSQNLNTFWNSSSYAHNIGAADRSAGNDDFNGYLAEVHFIDGTALDASSFGETKSGVWIPKAYSGSYGTNGFYLDFDGTYYNDKSGNGNNFTANNLAATDVVLDSPTNNFATLNPLNQASNTFSEGNLKTTYSNYQSGNRSTFGMSSGKWYFEFLAPTAPAFTEHGIAREDFPIARELTSLTNQSIAYLNNDGKVWNGSSAIVTGLATWGSTDIIGIAVDIDNDSISFYKNNTLQTTVTSVTLSGYTWFAASTQATNSTTVVVHNYGQDSSFAGNKTAQGNTDANGYGDFYYAPPTGYLALCTANLTVPDAMNPALDNSPQDYFNTVLYTGDGTTSRSITGVGFQPDWLWRKNRSSAASHIVNDVLRGTNNVLVTHSTGADQNLPAYLSSFDADGFTMATSANDLNASGQSYVAWNWKANGSGVSNTDGSITSTVSANTDAGFSIVSYTGTGANATVGHGLSSAPEMIITKNRTDSGAGWIVYHASNTANPETDYLVFNSTDATADYPVWNDTLPTSSVFSLGGDNSVNGSSDAMIAYCFHSVAGFSKAFSFTGNGSSDGPFIFCDFKPAFVLYKNASAAADWMIFDNKRTHSGTQRDYLEPNTSDAEGFIAVDLLSNGFKVTEAGGTKFNASGNTYIGIAFAESPFKYSTAR